MQDRQTEHPPEAMNERDSLVWRASSDPFFNASMVAIALLEGEPAFERAKSAVKECVARVPRLSQCVAEETSLRGTPSWVACENFDLDLHFHQGRTPDGFGMKEVLELAQSSALMPFDRSLPLWEFELLEGLEGGRGALIHKLHHTLVDGMGAIELMAHLYDAQPEDEAGAQQIDPSKAGKKPRAKSSRSKASASRSKAAPLEHDLAIRSAAAALRSIAGISRELQREVGRLRSIDPAHVAGALEPLVKSARESLDSIRRVAIPNDRAMSPIATRRSKGMRFASFEVDFEALYRAAKKRDCTLNDAFLTALASGWRRYHSVHAADTPHLICAFPINLRPANSSGATGDGGDAAESTRTASGNEIGFGRIRVSLEQADCEQQMLELHADVRELRQEPAVGFGETLAALANLVPPSVVHLVGPYLAKQNDFAASCLPGPRNSVYFAGKRALELHAFGPRMGSAVNFTFLSYAAGARVGVNADPAAIPDVPVLVDAMKAGFNEVAALG